jgi:hypothetical protein
MSRTTLNAMSAVAESINKITGFVSGSPTRAASGFQGVAIRE